MVIICSVSGVDSKVGSWLRYGHGREPSHEVKRQVRGARPWAKRSVLRAEAQAMCALAKP